MIAVYAASKAKHAPWWRALRATGIEVCSSWVDWPHNAPGSEPTAEQWSRHWTRCIDEARDCDVLLFVSNQDEQACGALIELGAALANGALVYIVSPHWCSVSHHPRCRTFKTIEGAIDSIVALMAGEKARRRMLRAVQQRKGSENEKAPS